MAAVMGASSCSPKLDSQFLAMYRLVNSSDFSSEGHLRYSFSTSTRSALPCVIEDSKITVKLFAAIATVCLSDG